MSAEMVQMLFSLQRFEDYIARMWEHYNDTMRDCVLMQRRREIAKLQKLQLKEFNHE